MEINTEGESLEGRGNSFWSCLLRSTYRPATRNVHQLCSLEVMGAAGSKGREEGIPGLEVVVGATLEGGVSQERESSEKGNKSGF